MKVKVLFFAKLKERLGKSHLEIDMPKGARAADLLESLFDSAEERALWAGHLLFAINSRYADRLAALKDGDEVALIPPVAGG